MGALGIIPSYVRSTADVEVFADAMKAVRRTEPDLDVLVVDDGSPQKELVTAVESLGSAYGFELVAKDSNEGFSATVNVGLRRCLEEERDAVLINADLEPMHSGWLEHFQTTRCIHSDRPASVVGALLVYPQGGLVQHAGIYFSNLTRTFDHLWKYAPMSLPAAQKPKMCPVTGAFQFIRHEALTAVGIYDPEFFMGWEDVDYCLRVFKSGRECVYNPRVRGWHHESMFRGRPSPKIADWQLRSYLYLAEKYRGQSFAGMVPTW